MEIENTLAIAEAFAAALTPEEKLEAQWAFDCDLASRLQDARVSLEEGTNEGAKYYDRLFLDRYESPFMAAIAKAATHNVWWVTITPNALHWYDPNGLRVLFYGPGPLREALNILASARARWGHDAADLRHCDADLRRLQAESLIEE